MAMKRPDLPIGNSTYGEWCVRNEQALGCWFLATHQQMPPLAGEMDTFRIRQWNAQIMVEDDLVNGRTS